VGFHISRFEASVERERAVGISKSQQTLAKKGAKVCVGKAHAFVVMRSALLERFPLGENDMRKWYTFARLLAEIPRPSSGML